MKARTIIGITRMRDDDLLRLGLTIHEAMLDNPYFVNPTPSLATLAEKLDDYTIKLANAKKRGSMEDTALKNESREELIKVIQHLGHYVNMASGGRLAVVLSSGFPITHRRFALRAPSVVEGLKLSDGRQSGQVKLQFEKQKEAQLYEYTYKQEGQGEEEWVSPLITSSSRGNIIAPLEVGRFYEFKVRAINKKGRGDWSSISRILVR